MTHFVRRSVAVLLIVAMTLVLSSAAIPPPPDETTDGQRGINVVTMLTQGATIYDHPDATPTGEPQATYDTLAQLGHKLIRLPVDWSYLQPGLDVGDPRFHEGYWRSIRNEVAKIGGAGMRVVLDLHNGCEWVKPKAPGATPLVCGAGLSTAATTDVWRKISAEFKDDRAVVAYDLFNEPTRFNSPNPGDPQDPRNQSYSTYKAHVNAIVAAIRAQGDRKTIWVESLCCTKNLDVNRTDPDGGWVVDPMKRIVYSLHMYPVPNSADGETFNPAKLDPRYEVPRGKAWSDLGYVTGFLGRVDAFGGWCRRNGLACSVGEVGWYGSGQSEQSAVQWNELGDRWYDIADGYGLAVTYFGASSAYKNNLWAYDTPGPDAWFPVTGMTRKQPQAAVIEKSQHLSKP